MVCRYRNVLELWSNKFGEFYISKGCGIPFLRSLNNHAIYNYATGCMKILLASKLLAFLILESITLQQFYLSRVNISIFTPLLYDRCVRPWCRKRDMCVRLWCRKKYMCVRSWCGKRDRYVRPWCSKRDRCVRHRCRKRNVCETLE